MKIAGQNESSYIKLLIILSLAPIVLFSCRQSSHEQMIGLLAQQAKISSTINNPYSYTAKLASVDSALQLAANKQNNRLWLLKASLLLKVGKEQESVSIYDSLANHSTPSQRKSMLRGMGIANMRLGERTNCMLNHNGSSCIFPIKDAGIQKIQTGSKKAIDIYEEVLNNDTTDLESRWLLNIAFMALGEYPKEVPRKYLIPGLDADTGYKIKPFTDMAPDLGLDINEQAGGVIIDDFNNDGYLDIVTTSWGLTDPMHYFQNNKDGTFTDKTEESGLKGITGGLNMMQTDYNNDGNLDIYVLRGAWKDQGWGNQPGSLLRNNGDGTFTDVTISSGLLAFHPTQTATWADFNNDGWLDLFVGYENTGRMDAGGVHHCALFINNRDGTFTDVAAQAHCDIVGFVKGVTAADYNNDGWPDLFISNLNGRKYLLKNRAKPGTTPDFEDVTAKAGFDKNKEPTFSTWFFDYNNDGWPDIIAGDFDNSASLGRFAALEALGKPVPNAGNVFLFRNNRDGTFTDVTKETGLNKVVFGMGANFGDIDNDGYPDMYFGTGNPDFTSLVPNKLFKNIDGKRFADVTESSRTGNLQKGHGVAFADIRNTGLQDIFIKMGGAYVGDSYPSSLYVNPGQNNNNWISLKLEGVKANRAAIGSRIKLTFTENGVKRSVYKDVNSGGSFGASPLRQEIGVGQAKVIDEIEIKWAGSQTVQRFYRVAVDQFLHITEGKNQPEVLHLAKLTFKKKSNAPGMGMSMQ